MIATELNYEPIKGILPQRYPFLMLDKVVEIEPGVRVVGIKNMTGNEWFYQGHFPDKAITPGVMMCEAMAQTGIILFHVSQSAQTSNLTYLLGGFKVRFLEPSYPGDQLCIEAIAKKLTTSIGLIEASVSVNSKVVVRGEFSMAAKKI